MRLVVAALALAAAIPSCGGGPRIDEGELRSTVLQPRDLPGFARFSVGAWRPPEGEGWQARYRWAGAESTRGPLVVESRAVLLDDEDEAARAVRADAGRLEGDEADHQRIGDASIVMTSLQPGVPRDVRSYAVLWRDANVRASVLANGFEGRFSVADLLALARKQQRRIAAAAR